MRRIFVSFFLLSLAVLHADVGNRGAWGDQGDGTFKNPILPGDFSDPDVIRVEDDFYLIASTFQYSPGMAILHSKDMVNWSYVGHCIPDISKLGKGMNWTEMAQYNRGVYAGSLRYHNGRFYMFTTTLSHGLFMSSAPAITGPWDDPVRLSDKSWTDDNCPFWDDDGKAYMVYSDLKNGWFTHLVEMSPDAKTVYWDTDKVIDDFKTSEGNKIYKIDGTYYIFHNENRSQGNRVGTFMRAKNIQGPWEKKLVLQGDPPLRDREPNQGALVQLKDKSWWFFTHQGRGGFFEGRPTSLLPVKWVDGWPVPGEIGADGVGRMGWSYPKPINGQPIVVPQSSDDFSAAKLGPQWEWNHEPRAGFWSLTERPGFLRLKAFKPIDPAVYYKKKKPAEVRADGFFTAGNMITQRVMGYEGGEVITRFDVSGLSDGQVAGLALFHSSFARLGVTQKDGVRTLEYNRDEKNILVGPVLNQPEFWVKAVIGDQPKPLVTFAYSLDGKTYISLGDAFELEWANYRGSRIGIYNFNTVADAGHLDVDSFSYVYRGPHNRSR